VEEVEALRPHYDPHQIIHDDEDLARVFHLLESGHFNTAEPGIFDDVIASMRSPSDPWMTVADFRSYVDTQQRVADTYRDRDRWLRMSILNTASSGFFSTDRTMEEYNRDIWKLRPMTLDP
jgi:starch phosphorylase